LRDIIGRPCKTDGIFAKRLLKKVEPGY